MEFLDFHDSLFYYMKEKTQFFQTMFGYYRSGW